MASNKMEHLLYTLFPRRRARQNGGQAVAPRSGGSASQGAETNPPARASAAPSAAYGPELVVDLERRRNQLTGRLAELQWDLGGLVYEMAIRNRIRVDVLIQRAAALQDADAELSEVERIVRMEQTGTAGSCGSCGAPHSSGATYCWQCGNSLLQQVSGEAILRS
jgi:hypothetical protein